MMNAFLIVGLGNNSARYRGTRHNVGFAVCDELCSRAFPQPTRMSTHKKTGTECAELRVGRARGIVVKPLCLMNVSGRPVQAAARFFSIPIERIIVIHDELDLDFGEIRTRRGGSERGHNGLRSITQSLGTRDYQRISVGIGRPPGRMTPASYVLKPFSASEQLDLPVVCADAADAVEALLDS